MTPADDGRQVELVRSACTPPTSSEAAASRVLSERPWGTAIDLEVDGLRPGDSYGVWLERREGGRLPAGSFRLDGDGTLWISLGSALTLADSGAVGVALLPGRRHRRRHAAAIVPRRPPPR